MSNRQSILLNRMRSAKERYTKSKTALDRMLLNYLHGQGVYTLDQFRAKYMKQHSREQQHPVARTNSQPRPFRG